MRVLVVGYGSIGKRHAANAQALGHDVRVFDTDPTIEIPFEPAMHDVTDAVVVASPASQHARQASQFYGIPTLVEKPLALTAAEWSERSRDDSCIWVGYNLRFHPGYRLVKQALEGMRGRVHASFLLQCDKSGWPGKSYEDILLEGSHEIDLALWMLGPATVLDASGHGDRWVLTLEHSRGDLSSIVLNGTSKDYWRGVNITTDGAQAQCAWGQNGDWQMHTKKGAWVKGVTTADATYRAELQEFFRCARGETRDALCTAQEGLDVLRICDVARERAESHAAQAS